jgi:predicted RNase H-like nuclease (RuvC/YqgF family)
VLVQRNDSELMTIEELRRTIEHLEHEDSKKTEERQKLGRDIEQVEEHFKIETKDYLTTIKRLQVLQCSAVQCSAVQEENRKLSSSLTAATERDSGVSEDESYIEIDLVSRQEMTN